MKKKFKKITECTFELSKNEIESLEQISAVLHEILCTIDNDFVEENINIETLDRDGTIPSQEIWDCKDVIDWLRCSKGIVISEK